MSTADNPQPDKEQQKSRYKEVRYHEAGHAVLMWDLGAAVDRVVANREEGSGHVMPGQGWFGRYDLAGRIAEILVYLAGSVAHRCFEQGAERTKPRCSSVDLKAALNLIATLGDIPAGAEICLLKMFLDRTIQLIDTPEVQTQIREIAALLQPHGCLLTRQVHVHLKSLPVTRKAVQLCRQLVAEIKAELPTLLQKAAEAAPRIAAHQNYHDLIVLFNSIGVDPQAKP